MERNIAFEDESYVVMNRFDLPNVCILAVEGYGEREMLPGKNDEGKEGANTQHEKKGNNYDVDGGVLHRGKRAWQDIVGGATICCNQCCSILGYASLEEPDTCRLLKHRLFAKAEETNVNKTDDFIICEERDFFSQNTCASFVAREIVRYAESQAVFTFMIFSAESRKILMIKLLSWNTSLQYHQRSSYRIGEIQRREKDYASLGRAAKVIYEEINNIEVLAYSDDIDDMVNFTWGGYNQCCPHLNTTGTTSSTIHNMGEKVGYVEPLQDSTASVQIHLALVEYEEIKNALETGSKFFPRAISRPTIVAKLGSDGESKKGKAALSFLGLPLNQ